MTENQNQSGFRFAGEDDFELAVSNSSQPVLVVFSAPWSHPCQVIDSVLADLVATCGGSVNILKVDADDNPYLSLRFGVDSIPTLLCFVAGNLREKLVGTASKEAVLRLLRRHGMPDSGQPATRKEPMISSRTFAEESDEKQRYRD